MGETRPLNLRFTVQAATELEQVLDNIADRSVQGADRVKLRIQKTLNLLVEHPFSGKATSHPDLRRIVATPYPYLIFYRIDAEDVVIIGIRHAARHPSSMPENA